MHSTTQWVDIVSSFSDVLFFFKFKTILNWFKLFLKIIIFWRFFWTNCTNSGISTIYRVLETALYRGHTNWNRTNRGMSVYKLKNHFISLCASSGVHGLLCDIPSIGKSFVIEVQISREFVLCQNAMQYIHCTSPGIAGEINTQRCPPGITQCHLKGVILDLGNAGCKWIMTYLGIWIYFLY